MFTELMLVQTSMLLLGGQAEGIRFFVLGCGANEVVLVLQSSAASSL